jgi:hypothetical protein
VVTGQAPPRRANGKTAMIITMADRWAPHISALEFKFNPEFNS